MKLIKKLYYKWIKKPKDHLGFCKLCSSWNPWHHPYTIHCIWCPKYKYESKEDKAKNQNHWNKGGYYDGNGWPKDNIFDQLLKR